ncbi:MAG: NusG domain II-containing protein [Clostridia bacterium]|nr:NusG domain II-containing protein [Clostridia bacterium]
MKMFKKADIILGVILIIICGAAFFIAGLGGEKGEAVRITVRGQTYGVYSLFETREVKIDIGGHHNKILIADGGVSMVEADCPGKECIKQGRISRINQPIVCLPNQVAIFIEGKGSEVDAVL